MKGIMSDKTIAQKLMLKPGRTLALHNAPAGMVEKLAPLPEFAKLIDSAETADVVMFFAHNFQELLDSFNREVNSIKTDAVFWTAYPKKTGKLKLDIDRDTLHIYASTLGWLGVALVSLDDDWSAMRFKKA
jgi:hypothetical protein